MKKKIDCARCGHQFRADGYKLGFAVLIAGTCPKCQTTLTSLSGTPGQVMAQSLVLADVFMDSAFVSADCLGLRDPCLLEPEQILAYAQA